MKTFRWMAAVVAAALVLAACGSMQEAGTEPEIGLAAIADETIPATEDNSSVDHWLAETGVAEAGGTCFLVRPNDEEPLASDNNFFVYDPYDEDTDTHYVWTLMVVTRGDTHHLFVDPQVGDELETGGYDAIIGCKVPEEPEPDPEWCSPGYWRQPHHLDSWEPTGFEPSDSFAVEIGYVPNVTRQGARQGAPTDPTLIQVLENPQWYGGAAFNAVGDLLSAAHPDINFTGERVQDSCPLN